MSYKTGIKGVFASKAEIISAEIDATALSTNYPDLKLRLEVQPQGQTFTTSKELATWFKKDGDPVSIASVGTTFLITRVFEQAGVNLNNELKGIESDDPELYADLYSRHLNKLTGKVLYYIDYANRIYNDKVRYTTHSKWYVSDNPDEDESVFPVLISDFRNAHTQGYLRGRNAYRPELLDEEGRTGTLDVDVSNLKDAVEDLPF